MMVITKLMVATKMVMVMTIGSDQDGDGDGDDHQDDPLSGAEAVRVCPYLWHAFGIPTWPLLYAMPFNGSYTEIH